MAKTTFTLTHDRAGDYKGSSTDPARLAANKFLSLVNGALGGCYPGATTAEVAQTQATGTVTLSGVIGVKASGTVTLSSAVGVAASGTVTLGGGAGDVTVVVGGTSVGPVAFNTDDATTAGDVITALNANGTVAALVTATSGGAGVITITADAKGTAGNAITLTASRTAGTATASGATLENGAQAVTVVFNGTTVSVATEGVDDTATAVLVAAALNGNSTIAALATATSEDEVITIEADTYGTAGNAYTLTSSAGGGSATASGATLEGGTNNTVTATINGVAIAEVATGLADATVATALAAAINASGNALVSNHVTATSSEGVVTLTAKHPGHPGNAVTLAASGTGATASGARLTGGASTTYTF